MSQQEIDLPTGYRLEFWAEGPGSLRIAQDGATLWQAAFSDHPDFYSYHHREGCRVSFAWDHSDAMLFCYGYDPTTVEQTGITLWEFGRDSITHQTGPEIDAWMHNDLDRPKVHFSPVGQWMNDPNGLSKVGDTWHMFYQFHPASTDWGPMHWGHATSKDLINWTHMPVFLHPDQNLWRLGATGGAFSGNAFQDRDGSRMFFFTERLPAYDLFSGYREIQKIARPDAGWLQAESITTVLEHRPDGVFHDFRDPKVWWDEASGAYRMVLGASLHGDPAVLLYGSDDLRDWTYLGPLFRAPERFRNEGARAVECPDFFPLDGKWVLIMGFVGHTEPATGRHNLLYALVGDFVDDRFVTEGELQLLDFGTDFYAMQSFEANGRQIAFAWLFNWEDRKPAGSPYSGEMSLPRELSLDEKGRLRMAPAREFEAHLNAEHVEEVNSMYPLADAAFDLALSGNLEGTQISVTQDGQTSFEVGVDEAILWVRLPQDNGKIRYEAQIDPEGSIRVLHDRGIIEIFAENGAVCGTRRNYVNISPDQAAVQSAASISLSQLEHRDLNA